MINASPEGRAEASEDENFLRARVLYLVGELVDAIDVLAEVQGTNNIYKGIAVTHARQAAIWALKTKSFSTVESEPSVSDPA